MLFCIGATEDAASGRAARPGGSDPFRQTLLVLVARRKLFADPVCGLLVLLGNLVGDLLELRHVALAAFLFALLLLTVQFFLIWHA